MAIGNLIDDFLASSDDAARVIAKSWKPRASAVASPAAVAKVVSQMDPPSPIAIAPPSGMFTSYKVKGVLGSASGTIDTESQIAMIKAAIGGEDALQIIDNRGLGAIRRLRK